MKNHPDFDGARTVHAPQEDPEVAYFVAASDVIVGRLHKDRRSFPPEVNSNTTRLPSGNAAEYNGNCFHSEGRRLAASKVHC